MASTEALLCLQPPSRINTFLADFLLKPLIAAATIGFNDASPEGIRKGKAQ